MERSKGLCLEKVVWAVAEKDLDAEEEAAAIAWVDPKPLAPAGYVCVPLAGIGSPTSGAFPVIRRNALNAGQYSLGNDLRKQNR